VVIFEEYYIYMSSIFSLDNVQDFSEKINIDELYEKKQQHDLQKLELFNKILNRVHVKIKTMSRQKINEQLCWYLVPETILGVPKYDQAACIAYIMDKLKTSGFAVKYFHPNLLCISWSHWIPSYVRTEIKKKTGVSINEYGQKIADDDNDDKMNASSNDYLLKPVDVNQKSSAQKKEYTPIKTYKPSGNLLYDDEVLNKIEDKFT
jgi:hypothetical protein